MDKNSTQRDIKRATAIEKQVERWDLFAKIAPTIFLIVCFVLLLTGSISFDTVFTIGMVLFSVTAVTWWFWTIFSIRGLVRILNRASTNLIEVGDELTAAKHELKDIVSEENNNSKRN